MGPPLLALRLEKLENRLDLHDPVGRYRNQQVPAFAFIGPTCDLHLHLANIRVYTLNYIWLFTHAYSIAATDAGQLHDLTRAVLVTGAAEGMSIEAGVGIALVLHTRGLAQFCALPVNSA